MERIEQLLTFSKEFLLGKSFESLNENIILSLKETAGKSLAEIQSENDSFWENFELPSSKKHKYIQMNKSFKNYISFLSIAHSKTQTRFRTKHLFSISDDEDDSFENIRACFTNLMTLLMDLEIEYQHFKKVSKEDMSSELTPSPPVELLKMPKVFFIDFFASFSKLHTLFRYHQQNGINLAETTEKLSSIKSLLADYHRDKLVIFIWNKLKDYKKINKILTQIIRNCFSLYGEKIVTPNNLQYGRKESMSEKMSSMMNKPVSSLKLSVNLSKIKSKRSLKYNDSMGTEFQDMFYFDDMNQNFTIKCNEIPYIDPKKVSNSSLNNYVHQKYSNKRLKDDVEFGKCYCNIF